MPTRFPKIPTHPSEILKDILESYGLRVEESAKMLGVPFKTLANFLDGKSKMTLNLAYRLDLANVSSAAFWMALQANYDLVNFINAKKQKPNVDVASFEKIRLQKEKEVKAEESVIAERLTQKLLEREGAKNDKNPR